MQFKAAFLTLVPLILAIPLPPTSQLVGDAAKGVTDTDTSVGGIQIPGDIIGSTPINVNLRDKVGNAVGTIKETAAGKLAGVNTANPIKRGPPTDGSGELGIVDPNGANIANGDLVGHTDGTTDGSGDMGIGETTNGGDIVTGSADGSTLGSDALAGQNKRGNPTDGSGSLGVVDPNDANIAHGDLTGHTDGTTGGSGDIGAGETNNGGNIISSSADGTTVGSEALAPNRRNVVGNQLQVIGLASQNSGVTVGAVGEVNGGSPGISANAIEPNILIPRDNAVTVNTGDTTINAPVEADN